MSKKNSEINVLGVSSKPSAFVYVEVVPSSIKTDDTFLQAGAYLSDAKSLEPILATSGVVADVSGEKTPALIRINLENAVVATALADKLNSMDVVRLAVQATLSTRQVKEKTQLVLNVNKTAFMVIDIMGDALQVQTLGEEDAEQKAVSPTPAPSPMSAVDDQPASGGLASAIEDIKL